MTAGAEGATGELLNAMATDVRTMLQEEIAQLRAQLGETVTAGKSAAVLLGGAGVLGALAVGTSATALVRVLETLLPRPVAPVVATLVYGGGAAALARAGLAELARARQELPRTTGPVPPAATGGVSATGR
ncbi:MAG: phage holin family protein [Janthinobacterium lividum]